MTAVERTVVDVPHRPELGGRVEEVLKSLDLVRYLDPVKVADYVEMLDNPSLASIAGWWLETRRAALGVTDGYRGAMRARLPRSASVRWSEPS
jgi:predicted transcriptional regulator of viral defense system